MPCVCLANTFARWQAVKAQRAATFKTTKAETATALPDNKPQRSLVDGDILRVPHQRKAFAKAQPAVSMSGVAQPIYTRKPDLATRLKALENGRPSVRMTRADLINAESRLGSTIFGPIPAGHRREFFHDRNNIWIWHEDWYDGQNNPHQMTVRYEVRTSGIYKKVASGKYLKLEGDELENFRKATHAYLYVIKKNLYNRPQLATAS